MAIQPLIFHPAAVLTQPAEEVTVFDQHLKKLLSDMYDTMSANDGVGLAAPQIGLSKKIAVVDIGEESGKLELMNPVIIEAKGEQTGPEGCLSIPGLYGEVTRPDYIKVRAMNRHGEPFEMEASGFLSRAIQHEIDHLEGILFTSKVNRYYEEDELEKMEG